MFILEFRQTGRVCDDDGLDFTPEETDHDYLGINYQDDYEYSGDYSAYPDMQEDEDYYLGSPEEYQDPDEGKQYDDCVINGLLVC